MSSPLALLFSPLSLVLAPPSRSTFSTPPLFNLALSTVDVHLQYEAASVQSSRSTFSDFPSPISLSVHVFGDDPHLPLRSRFWRRPPSPCPFPTPSPPSSFIRFLLLPLLLILFTSGSRNQERWQESGTVAGIRSGGSSSSIWGTQL